MQPALAAARLDRLLRDVVDLLALERSPVARLEELRLGRGEEIEVVLREEVLPIDAEELLAGPVDPLEPQLSRLLHEDHVRDVLHDRAEEGFARAERLLRGEAPPDLAAQARERDEEQREARDGAEEEGELGPPDVSPRPRVAEGEDAILFGLHRLSHRPDATAEDEPVGGLRVLLLRDAGVQPHDSLAQEALERESSRASSAASPATEPRTVSTARARRASSSGTSPSCDESFATMYARRAEVDRAYAADTSARSRRVSFVCSTQTSVTAAASTLR